MSILETKLNEAMENFVQGLVKVFANEVLQEKLQSAPTPKNSGLHPKVSVKKRGGRSYVTVNGQTYSTSPKRPHPTVKRKTPQVAP